MDRSLLYDLAFAYKKTKLWNHLYDDSLFAIECKDGTICYVCVMGMIGEHNAVSVFTEEEMQSYYCISESSFFEVESPQGFEKMISMSCCQCAFETKDMLREDEIKEVRAYAKEHHIRLAGKNAYPQFERYRTHKVPWKLADEADMEHLADALEAAIALSDAMRKDEGLFSRFERISTDYLPPIPFLRRIDGQYRPDGTVIPPEKKMPVYHKGEAGENELISKIKSKRRRGTIECGVIWVNSPIQDSEDDTPYFPVCFMAVEEKDGMIFSYEMAASYENDYQQMVDAFLNGLCENRKTRPVKIVAQDMRTAELIRAAAEAIGSELVISESVPELLEAEYGLHMEFSGRGVPDEEDGLYDLEEMLEMLEMMPDEALCSMPDFIKEHFYILADMPGISPHLRDRMDQIAARLEEFDDAEEDSDRKIISMFDKNASTSPTPKSNRSRRGSGKKRP